MAPHSSTLAWKIPWTEEPGWLQSLGVAKSRTRLSDFIFTFHFHELEKEMATHSSVLACRIPGTGEPGGLPSMGSHRVGHNWSDLAAAAAVANMRPELNCSSSWTGGWVLPLYSTSREESASFLFWSWIMKENPFDCQILSWPHVSGSNFACGTLILCLRVTPNVSL